MRQPISVLLVESHRYLLDRLADFLAEQDDVILAGSVGDGDDAITLAQELQPDVVVIDPFQPDFTALKTVPDLRQALPQARIVALSLRDVDLYREAALGAGADAFVSKVDAANELLPALRRVVSNSVGS